MRLVTSATLDRDVFDGLAHPIRRAILELLSHRPRPVGELAETFDVSLPAISRHLRLLRESGLVRETVQGRYRVYHLRPESMEDALEWMLQLREFWSSGLTSLGRYLDEKHATRTEDKDV
jgi:DNA-binding transcriptional ArsR family regulator